MAIRFNSSIRQERGEHYVDYVRRNTSTRRLVDPERLVHDLAHLNDGTPHSTICNLILHQYELARDVGDWRWIEATRRECSSILCSARWVDDHLPSLVHKAHSQKSDQSIKVLRSLCLRPLQLQCVWTFILVPT